MSTWALHPALEVNKLGKKIPGLKGIRLRRLSLVQAPTPPDVGPLQGNAHSTYIRFSRFCKKIHSFLQIIYILSYFQKLWAACITNYFNEGITNLGQTGKKQLQDCIFHSEARERTFWCKQHLFSLLTGLILQSLSTQLLSAQ